MPIYSYKCAVCGATFDSERRMNDGLSEVSCPNGHIKIRRVYSAPSIIFKGSGFYVTDSRKKPVKVKGAE
ncbi:FmdB family zinc ribbon protein [Chloroflexota bacterium]